MPANPDWFREAALVKGCIFILSNSTFKDTKEVLNTPQHRIIGLCKRGWIYLKCEQRGATKMTVILWF